MSRNRRARRAAQSLFLHALYFVVSFSLAGPAVWARAEEPSAVTAIDIALDPDATMIAKARAANARLLQVFPAGFALDGSHHAHVTCLQRYVRTADLDEVYEAVGRVVDEERPTAWTLRAYEYFYVVWDGIGLAGIVIEPTDGLVRFQRKLIDAVAPFAADAGTAAAFVTTQQAPDINEPTMDYVRTFVPKATGPRFKPHVTIGLAPEDYLEKLLAERFEPFTFSPVGVSVYQLGNFGTARKKLHSWR